MARKTIKRSKRLYNKMDKRKRKTKGKIRRKHRTKKLNKKGGCFGGICGSKPEKEQEMFVINELGEVVGPVKLNRGDIREIINRGGRVLTRNEYFNQYLRNKIRK